MGKCKCDFRTKLVGDGCQHCNPQITIDSLNDEIQTLRAQVETLMEALKYQRTRCEDIIDIRLIDEAIATYDKLSEVEHDTK